MEQKNIKLSVVSRILGEEEMSKQRTGNIQGRETTLYDTMMVDTCDNFQMSKSMEYTTTRLNPNVN